MNNKKPDSKIINYLSINNKFTKVQLTCNWSTIKININCIPFNNLTAIFTIS